MNFDDTGHPVLTCEPEVYREADAPEDRAELAELVHRLLAILGGARTNKSTQHRLTAATWLLAPGLSQQSCAADVAAGLGVSRQYFSRLVDEIRGELLGKKQKKRRLR